MTVRPHPPNDATTVMGYRVYYLQGDLAGYPRCCYLHQAFFPAASGQCLHMDIQLAEGLHMLSCTVAAI